MACKIHFKVEVVFYCFMAVDQAGDNLTALMCTMSQ